MGDWPLGGGARVETIGALASGTTSATAVVASGTVNTKGSWAELTDSAPVACSSFLLIVNFDLASYLMDIGIGPLGSEQILVPDIHRSSAALMPTSFVFPVRIPAGARVVARSASTLASSSSSTCMYLMAEGFSGAIGRNRVVTYGAVTADSGGTSIDPGGTAHTKGTWTQITASTPAAHKGLAIALGNQANATATGTSWLFDIAVGGSGSEQIMISNYRASASVNETVSPSFSPFFPVSIPQGSRLAMRSQCIVTDATDRLLDVVLYGLS